MAGARHGLLAGLVDYAGLFPPAALNLSTALGRFDAHERSDRAWMLGRFVMPAARLDEVVPWLAGPWTPQRPLPLSLLATVDDLAALAVLVAEHPTLRIEALEFRPPTAGALSWLDRLAGTLVTAGFEAAEVYVELPPGRDQELLAALAAGQGSHPARRLGGKLRCGGVTEDLVPAPERVAAVLTAARDAGVPLKFTAGLHHPVRAMAHTGAVPMHGFINVYAAALLAYVHGLTPAALLPILGETDPSAFVLTDARFAWRDLGLNAEQLTTLRATVAGGYGSCSFSEPVHDLLALGLLL